MNIGLWIQYGIVGVLVVASVVYAIRKVSASARTGDCAGGCSQCNHCGTGSADQTTSVAPITLQRAPHDR